MLNKKELTSVLRQHQSIEKCRRVGLPKARTNVDSPSVEMRKYICPDGEYRVMPYVPGRRTKGYRLVSE